MAYQFDEHMATPSAMLDIARGHWNNVKAKHIFGFNRTIGTSFETIFNDGGGIYQFPSAAITLTAVSSSAADTMDLVIEGLDADYNPVIDTVTLTGTVAASSNIQFFRINNAYIAGGENAGNITIANGGVTYAYIEANTGVSQNAIYTVPAGCKMYINNVQFSSGTANPNKYLTGRIYSKSHPSNAVQRFWQATWSTSEMSYSVPLPFAIPEKTDFAFEAKSSSGENEIAVYVNAFVIDNE